jgi:serpin B
VLVNAIYFKSTWKEKFDASKTAPLPFYLTNNNPVQASFMDGAIDYNRYDDNEVSVFELPYSNSKFSMVIAMPATGTTLQQLVMGLDSSKWQTWVNGLHATNSELKLPKFTFSYNTGLINALTSLGLGIAFTPNADFSGINATVPLQITAVNQKAFVGVDETGTTAAAATTVVVGTSAIANPPPNVIDHPFVFMIREMSSGVILFAGVVNNPLLTGE